MIYDVTEILCDMQTLSNFSSESWSAMNSHEISWSLLSTSGFVHSLIPYKRQNIFDIIVLYHW